jgi:hypothetical protein
MRNWKTNFDVIEGQMTFWEWLENLEKNEQILLEEEYES